MIKALSCQLFLNRDRDGACSDSSSFINGTRGIPIKIWITIIAGIRRRAIIARSDNYHAATPSPSGLGAAGQPHDERQNEAK